MADHIGTKVSIPGTRGQGILRYYGLIDSKNGIFGGIELIGPIAAARGKNSGSVNGVQYFEVQQPMTGLFLPFERLKSVNAHLANNLRLGSSLRSSTPVEIASTPSPLNRGTLTSLLSSNSSISKNGTLRSPYYEKPILNPKRNILKDKEINTITKSKSLSDNSTSLPYSSNDIKYVGNTNVESEKMHLEQELYELKIRYENNQQEMTEKIKILNELRNTVNEIQPLLEDYENDLSEKDKKLLKQKSEFEKAREEWRQSLDLMVSTQQENEEYYDQRISELNAQVDELSKTQTSGNAIKNKQKESDNQSDSLQIDMLSKDEEISKCKAKIEDLQKEKSEVEKSLNEKADSQREEINTLTEKLPLQDGTKNNIYTKTLLEKNDSLIAQLQTIQVELDKLRASDTSTKVNLAKLQFEVVEKDKIIEQLKSNESANDNELNFLLQEVKAVKINDNSDEYLKLKENYQKLNYELDSKVTSETKINELENQLEMRPTFEELTDLQNTIDELDSLHKNELIAKEDALKAVMKDNESLECRLRKMLQELESKDNQSQKTQINGSSEPSGLPIYTPKQPTDPSSGKSDWCGLCERDGHSSIKCPYENDMF